jgi:excisionase family DNA binding protein
MPSTDETLLITIEKAAELLNKSSHSVRQFVQRGKLVRHQFIGRNVRVSLDEILTYYSRKKNLPAWESHQAEIRNKTFVSMPYACDALMVQPSYIIKLIRKHALEGYVTASGDIMIAKDSINAYLRMPDNDTDSL